MLWFIVYVIGYVLAFLQSVKNSKKLDGKYTNGDMVVFIFLSLLSWSALIAALVSYYTESDEAQDWFKKER